MEKRMLLALVTSSVALSGCGVHNVENTEPSKYHRAADYASDVVKRSGCIGRIDDLLFSSGEIFVNDYGLNYSSSNAGLHCTKTSFRESMSRYCQSKSGVFLDGWCSVDDVPIFKVDGFTTLERGPSQSADKWIQSNRQWGIEGKRDQQVKSDERQRSEMEEKERVVREKNMEVDTKVGDLICREDYEAKPYQYPGVAYYKAYVEKKEKNKLQLRLVWHGGDRFVVNDITNVNNIIWSSPRGWRRCN